MKFAHIEENGKLLGWYNENLTSITMIEVTDEAWQNALENNHNKVSPNGTTEIYDFRTEAEIAENRISEIDMRLKEIDVETVRPLRAISNGTAVQFDTDKLKALDLEVATLRAERLTLVTA